MEVGTGVWHGVREGGGGGWRWGVSVLGVELGVVVLWVALLWMVVLWRLGGWVVSWGLGSGRICVGLARCAD